MANRHPGKALARRENPVQVLVLVLVLQDTRRHTRPDQMSLRFRNTAVVLGGKATFYVHENLHFYLNIISGTKMAHISQNVDRAGENNEPLST